MDFTFIHAADIHLDSPLVGLERYEGAPVEYVRGATRQAFRNLVQLALEEKVNFVLIAGDLYDGDWRDYNTGLFFAAQAGLLRQAGIPIYLVRGNHDAASQITRQLRLPDNVYDFSTRKPETKVIEELAVAIHGQGFPTRDVSEDLSKQYPAPLTGHFNIGLLHTCATGREGHGNYAPCDVDYLKNKGYDYWALGHVHNREELSREPWIIFPGNIQGRHIRESGPKGCTLVRVQDGRVQEVRPQTLDVLRWHLCKVDAASCASYGELLERAKSEIGAVPELREGHLLALRLVLSGACPIHRQLQVNRQGLDNDLRALATEQGPESIWIEKVRLQTRPQTRAGGLLAGGPVDTLRWFMAELGTDDTFLEELVSALERERNTLPGDLFQEGELDPGDPQYLGELLPQVEELILSRLCPKEAD
ncbi:MAG: DNA repair exonuclease [Peptococcaceae bacterium]|nr:DNA repair exonuclease [Peptococcaceae bacterium]